MTESDPTSPDAASAEGAETLELWPEPAALRRSRAFGGLLILNWIVMGYFVVTQGIASLTGGAAFVLGLLALLGGVSQLRGARLAERTPLVRLDGDRLRFRRYTAAEPQLLALETVRAITISSRDQIVLATTSGETVQVPTLALSEADRDRLENALRRRLGD